MASFPVILYSSSITTSRGLVEPEKRSRCEGSRFMRAIAVCDSCSAMLEGVHIHTPSLLQELEDMLRTERENSKTRRQKLLRRAHTWATMAACLVDLLWSLFREFTWWSDGAEGSVVIKITTIIILHLLVPLLCIPAHRHPCDDATSSLYPHLDAHRHPYPRPRCIVVKPDLQSRKVNIGDHRACLARESLTSFLAKCSPAASRLVWKLSGHWDGSCITLVKRSLEVRTSSGLRSLLSLLGLFQGFSDLVRFGNAQIVPIFLVD